MATAPNGVRSSGAEISCPPLCFTDLQFIVFRRETIELIAVRQLTGKCREVVLVL